MKSQNQRVANVIFGIAATIFGAASLVKVDQLPQPDSDIFSPSAVEAGVLTTFSVQGSDVQWTVIPSVEMTVYGDENSFMATSFKEEGTYIVVAAYSVDGKTQLRVKSVDVGVTSEQPSAPETDSGPQPEAEQEPGQKVVTKYSDVAPYVEQSARASELDREAAIRLSNNFLMIARDIDEGVFENPRQVTAATAIANKRLNLTSQTAVDIQLLISNLKFKGDLVTLEDYADLWKQIGEGLANYVK